ncbi:two-component system sensor histidine kinase YesM [Hydrogenispora ethanolica]|uniref:histidine kinase n=1 Tax=Hydrogenispora ethanolica TaxID=1082276 RepID=A0A4R1R9B8_HYDET|nr:sensor histidine kinase [Hydrogenispora ethanolica]TCL62276.1 two-component system sensor histidine kinase YesM [Hydrogenispora ethanolica]
MPVALKQFYRTIQRRFSNLNIFHKLIIAFMFVIALPTAILYYFSLATTREIIIKQVCGDTLNSIELVANSVNYELKKMISVALYVNHDQNIKEIINQQPASWANAKTRNLYQLERINKVSGILENIAFTTMGTRCYMTVITQDGAKITNWPLDAVSEDDYFKDYTFEAFHEKDNRLLWRSLEPNYVRSNAQFEPYVLTLATVITDSWWRKEYGIFVISVPGNEFNKIISPLDPQQQRVMLDEKGLVISSSNPRWLNRTFSSIHQAEFPDNRKGYFIFKDRRGAKSIITYATIANMNWRVVNIRSYASLTAQLNKTTDRLLLVNLLCLAIFFGISSFIARSISAPLKKLTQRMLHFDLDEAPAGPLPERKDEVGILERSFLVMKENIHALVQENQAKERKKKDAELKALQAQIRPHFLFNTLNAVRWAALNNNPQKAATMVLLLTKLLKMTLVKGEEFIPLALEIENLQSYAEIFRLRHGTQFELLCELDEEILQYRIPRLLLQPLVENAIIHGFENLKSGGVIRINARKSECQIVITIRDNGKGIADHPLPQEGKKDLKFSGMGIQNVAERIKLYYGEEYGLKLSSEPGRGTTIEVTLPVPAEEAE